MFVMYVDLCRHLDFFPAISGIDFRRFEERLVSRSYTASGSIIISKCSREIGYVPVTRFYYLNIICRIHDRRVRLADKNQFDR